MRVPIAAGLFAGVMAAGLAAPTVAAAEPMPTGTFSSCKQLRADYPAGIAKNKRAAKQIVKQGYRKPIVCKRVYLQVRTSLDPNRNRVACEIR